MKVHKNVKRILVGIVLILVAIQFVPVDRSNPPVTLDIPMDVEVKNILRRTCYDCHSNQTTWPWYSYIAPVSWSITEEVAHGRSEMNFSTWDVYEESKRKKLIGEIWEEIESGEMPPAKYLYLHPEAVMTDAERERVRAWVESAQ